MNARYPFSAVVGLGDLKLALLLNAVSPRVGGVLVRGEKGTAKSTVVRALAAQLPAVEVVPGCRFACDPAAPDPSCPDGPHEPGGPAERRPSALVELPVGASEDRLAGSLDVERALTEGVKAFEPGLLAAAHRGVLYVDEVNLLHDHLVDLLLDAAALGTCYVERESLSIRHAARFLLVGTMNPEEGELRPQLLDRFGLTVEVRASREPKERAEVVRRRLAFEADPDAFAARWAGAEADLAERISAARERLGGVRLPDARLEQIATVCAGFEVDGLRADLVTANAALAHAAWQGRDEVTGEDVRAAARLSLPHRRRRDPFDAPGLDESLLDELLDNASPDNDPPPEGGTPPHDGSSPDDRGSPDSSTPPGADTTPGNRTTPGGRTESGVNEMSGDEKTPGDDRSPGGRDSSVRNGDEGAPAADTAGAGGGEQVAAVAAPHAVPLWEVPGVGDGAAGRRSRARTARGRITGARRPTERVRDLHVMATLLAAAPHQQARGRPTPAAEPQRSAATGPDGSTRERGRTAGRSKTDVTTGERGKASGRRGTGLVLRPGDLREAVREGR
ncbi:ATP-binding protein, partial [Actinomadura sp. BRA 177]|uniref:ATP-binding protein n=1 Tax=Actinomadura sp. BRA 177 TaxID=2745202 RepID=UPI0015963B37